MRDGLVSPLSKSLFVTPFSRTAPISSASAKSAWRNLWGFHSCIEVEKSLMRTMLKMDTIMPKTALLTLGDLSDFYCPLKLTKGRIK